MLCQALAEQGNLVQLDQHLLPTDTAVSKLPALKLNAEQSKSIGFGQRVKFTNEAKLRGQVRLFSDKNIFLGVALIDDNNVIRPQRFDYTISLTICLSVLIPVISPVTF